MAFATAPCKTHRGKARQAALVLGSALFADQLRNLLARSRWNFEWAGNSEAAIDLLDSDEFPVVICEGDWERIANRISQLDDPPAVVAVIDEADAKNCQEAVRSGILCIDNRQMVSEGLFPLLNHAWRMKSGLI